MTEPTSGTSAAPAQEYSIKGMKVAFAMPTYGPVDPITSKSTRAAVMFASNRGVIWTGDSSPDRLGYGAARNTAVQHTFKMAPESDGIMWVDSDIKPEIYSIARLLDTQHNGFDFVSGVYHQRQPCHNPIFHGWSDEKHCFQPAQDYPPDTIGRADGCGFGFVYTSLKMLNDIAISPSFEVKNGWFPDKRDVGGFGEDLTFCWMAKQAGYQLYVDSGIQVLHQADAKFIGQEDFRREKEAWIKSCEVDKPAEWGIHGDAG